jgi:2-oxoisovalerate dehydrogenase E1 component alpha subunit
VTSNTVRTEFSDFHVSDPAAQPPEVAGSRETLLQILSPDGVRSGGSGYDRFIEDVTDQQLLSLLEDMTIVRRIDTEATALQRQGELGLWPPLLGQEAAQIGSARALRSDDFVFTSYRENAVAWVRGVQLVDLVRVWRGTAHSGWNPFDVGMATPAVIIGAQTLHATGYAMGLKKDGVDSVAVAYFGDGATSQGDSNEAMIFAASFGAPVVFFCQNNQWAISEPVGLQAVRAIADRAPGFGIPSIRVDGNDVLAVMAATRAALDRARRGEGPTFIEAVTYRMGPHTTSDDPSRYEDRAEHEEWEAKDPIVRVERYLESEGVLSDSVRERIKSRTDEIAAEFRAACITLPTPAPLSIFDNIYSAPHSVLERQKRDYAAYLSYVEGGTR